MVILHARRARGNIISKIAQGMLGDPSPQMRAVFETRTNLSFIQDV